ncbi:hypothetical protein BB560_001759 [Smittium megazygosporum]|uniref:methionine--tRNA ligase n=1 Tax=Smittium megazygosporum TaxID=133381 RepID=A0A2T9ZGP3_9FUNG|nr:hypothetical protein BB560_001759 [Smittium megazygosporum]
MASNVSNPITIFVGNAKPTTGTPAAISLLKVFLACKISNVPFVIKKDPQVVGKLPFLLELNSGCRFVDPNAFIRYSCQLSSFGISARLEQEFLLEWEEKFLFNFIENNLKTSSELLSLVDSRIKNEWLKDGFSAAEIAIFSDVFNLFSILKDSEKSAYPNLCSWFGKFKMSEHVQSALSVYNENTKELLVRQVPTAENVKVSTEALFSYDPSQKVQVKHGERNILITSALPYVNNVPHLGNIIGSVLSADAFARYARARNISTLFVCGTDEYGTATETKALAENITCQELCDKYHKVHDEVYKWFDISFDIFGRTTTPKQTSITQDMFMKCHNNGYTISDTMQQLYCEQCKRFLADRFVEGTCPKCGYDDCRGDQCDNCGQLINAIELVSPRCKLDGNAPIVKSSTHLFLDLTKLQPECEKFVARSYENGKWSSNGYTITKSWLSEGLKPRCITRDLKWGVPVPLPGFEDKVFYVWFDACIGYVSITANYTDEWETWWKNPDHVQLYQFMGKDNVPFHTVVFPSTQVATGDPSTMLHHISTTEYLNYESGKFSKSRGIGVFGNNAKDTGVAADVWRYYLLSNRPESSDTLFTWNEFIARNNNELLANFGNFCNRMLKFTDAASKYAGVVPNPSLELLTDPNLTHASLLSDINALLAKYNSSMESVHLKAGLRIAMEISARGNQYLQESKFDNSLFMNNKKDCDTVVFVALNLIYLLSAVFSPFMPSTSSSICQQLNAPPRTIPDTFEFDIKPGHVIGYPKHLFSPIDEKMADFWREKYGGGKQVE